MTTANLIAWIVIGGLVGLLISWISNRAETGRGLVIDLILGLVGGFVGGAFLYAIGGVVGTEIIGVNLAGAVVAIVGALVLVFLVEWLHRPEQ